MWASLSYFVSALRNSRRTKYCWFTCMPWFEPTLITSSSGVPKLLRVTTSCDPMTRGRSSGSRATTGGGAHATAIWLLLIGATVTGACAQAVDTVPASATVAANVNIRDPMDSSYDFFSFDACWAFSSAIRFWASCRCSFFGNSFTSFS